MVGNGNHYHKRIRRLDHLGLGLNLGNIRRKQISGSYLIFFYWIRVCVSRFKLVIGIGGGKCGQWKTQLCPSQRP